MSMKYYGRKGTYEEGAFIKRGGEGTVYSIENSPSQVMKIYHAGKGTESRHRKILTMLDRPIGEDGCSQITWPEDILCDDKSNFVGYVMRRVSNTEPLNVLYSDEYKDMPKKSKVIVAKNLCAAINAVHEIDQVCGDLNPNNIGVNTITGRVTIFDADSFHIRDTSGNVYRCEVGMAEYLAAEIQNELKNGKTLASYGIKTFTKETDLFALAIHIFALLMNGCHPFACAVDMSPENIMRLSAQGKSVSAPQPIENICDGFFPFAASRSGIKIPAYAPPFSSLPEHMQKMFKRAFIDGHKNPMMRPTAADWYYALEKMEKSLPNEDKNWNKTGKGQENDTTAKKEPSKKPPKALALLLAAIAVFALTFSLIDLLNNPSVKELPAPISYELGSERDSAGRVIKQIETDTDGNIYIIEFQDYDGKRNRVCKMTAYNPDGSWDFTEKSEYDSNGNEKKSTYYNFDGTVKYWMEFEHDKYGKHIKTITHEADGTVNIWEP